MKTIPHLGKLGAGETKRAFAKLWHAMRERGHGTVSEVERSLGLGKRGLYHWRRRGTLRYAHLLAMLDVLDIDPGRFFDGLFPVSKPSDIRNFENVLDDSPTTALDMVAKRGSTWQEALAISKALQMLKLWSWSEKWIERALTLANSPAAQAECHLQLSPVATLFKADPTHGLELALDAKKKLDGAKQARALLYAAMADRHLGRTDSASRRCVSIILSGTAATTTLGASWQNIGFLLLSAAPDTAARCFKNGLKVSTTAGLQGHLLWSLGKASKSEVARSYYDQACFRFGVNFPYETFRCSMERFERFGCCETLLSGLQLICTTRAEVFEAILKDIEVALKLRQPLARILPSLKDAWNQWRQSQASRVISELSP